MGTILHIDDRSPRGFTLRHHGREDRFFLHVPARRSREEAWEQLQARLPHMRWHRRLLPLLGAAAAAALLFTLTFVLTGITTFTTVTGEIRPLLLPDSSHVSLGEKSRLRYNRHTWRLRRKISLTGSAFFSVRHGQRFTVTTACGSVSVLGTRFSVLARSDHFLTRCYEGRVQVTPRLGKQAILHPGLYLETTTDRPNTQPRKFDIHHHPPWNTRQHTFHNTPLNNVLNILAKQYHLQISFNPVITHERYYTGHLPDHDEEKALEMVCLPMGLTWKRTNGIINIERSKH